MNNIALLVESLREGYDKKSWHGVNLRGSLRALSAKDAAWRPGKGRHNIWEIAVHCAYWKYIVRRRLTGEKRGSFPLKGSNWYLRPERTTADAWKRDLHLLHDAHRALVLAVAELKSSALEDRPAGNRATNRAMIAGIAMHDVYHAGQIQIIRRLRRG